MSDKPENDSSSLPVRFWGLNPLFWTHIKLLVKEVQSLKEYTGYKGKLTEQGHSMMNVDCIFSLPDPENEFQSLRF